MRFSQDGAQVPVEERDENGNSFVLHQEGASIPYGNRERLRAR